MRPAHLLVALSLAACTSSVVLPRGGAGEFELAVGDRAVFASHGVEVRFEGITADSRCPVDVTCAWAGDAAAALLLSTPGSDPGPVTLHTGDGPDSTTAGTLVLTLVRVMPVPREGVVIDPATYRVRLRAEER